MRARGFRRRTDALNAMKTSRRRRILALFLLAPPLYGVALGAFLLHFGSRDRAQSADAILIFGAHVNRNGRASTILRARTRHAFDLYRRGLAPKIVCTGGIGIWPPAESMVEKRLLLEWGVPETAILSEETSTSTRENLRNAAALLPRGARVIGVSEAFHLWRCTRDGAKAGLKVLPSPETAGWDALPRRSRLAIVAREVVAVSRDLIFDLF